MLEGTEDLFFKEWMISIISSLDTSAITKSNRFRFLRNFKGAILGTFGIKLSVLIPTLAKKLLKLVAISLSLSMIFPPKFS